MIKLTTIVDLCKYLLGIESSELKNLCKEGNTLWTIVGSIVCIYVDNYQYSLNTFSLGFRALANFCQSTQHTMKIAEVEQHGRVEEICFSQLQFLVTGT